MEVTDMVKHGVCWTYQAHKCRCEPCVTAYRDYQKAYKLATAEKRKSRVRVCPSCQEQFSGTAGGYCKTCHAAKESERYHRTKNEPGKVEGRRAKHLMQTYGIGVEQYEAMYSDQDGKCGICYEEVEGRLYVDHCHDSGRVRGLLCSNCNFFLGWLEKNAALMSSASEYVARSATSSHTHTRR